MPLAGCNSDTRKKQSKPLKSGPKKPVKKKEETCKCKAAIEKPLGSLDKSPVPSASWITGPASPGFYFDFQGVVSTSSGPYKLKFKGKVEPASSFSCKWTLDPAAGTLTDDTKQEPKHTAPASVGEGNIKLEGMNDKSKTCCSDKKKVKIYKDHLERDRDNFGVNISCSNPWTFTKYGATITMTNTWNCFGSVKHAYNGSGSGYHSSSVGIPGGWSKTVYDAPMNSVKWTAINSSLARGDVVSFWSGSSSGGFSHQHAHTCKSGTTMYGANNEPKIRPSPSLPATWKWFETKSETYYNNVNAHPRTRDLLTRVIVHKKP